MKISYNDYEIISTRFKLLELEFSLRHLQFKHSSFGSMVRQLKLFFKFISITRWKDYLLSVLFFTFVCFIRSVCCCCFTSGLMSQGCKQKIENSIFHRFIKSVIYLITTNFVLSSLECLHKPDNSTASLISLFSSFLHNVSSAAVYFYYKYI